MPLLCNWFLKQTSNSNSQRKKNNGTTHLWFNTQTSSDQMNQVNSQKKLRRTKLNIHHINLKDELRRYLCSILTWTVLWEYFECQRDVRRLKFELITTFVHALFYGQIHLLIPFKFLIFALINLLEERRSSYKQHEWDMFDKWTSFIEGYHFNCCANEKLFL